MVQFFLCGRQGQISSESTMGTPPPHGTQKAKPTNPATLAHKTSAGQVQSSEPAILTRKTRAGQVQPTNPY